MGDGSVKSIAYAGVGARRAVSLHLLPDPRDLADRVDRDPVMEGIGFLPGIDDPEMREGEFLQSGAHGRGETRRGLIFEFHAEE